MALLQLHFQYDNIVKPYELPESMSNSTSERASNVTSVTSTHEHNALLLE